MKFVVKIIALVFVINFDVTAQIKDLINNVNLTAVKTDSVLISDMFYAEEYKVKVLQPEPVVVRFNNESRYLVFTPDENAEGYYTIGLNVNSKNVYFPVFVKKPIYHTFSFKHVKKYKELTVFGEFNGWNRHKDYFTDQDGDGIFEAKVEIDPGKYQYKFYADGEEIVDPNNPDSINNGMGAFNSVLTIPDLQKDYSFLHNLRFRQSDSKSIFEYYYERKNQPAELKNSDIIALLDNYLIADNNISISGNTISLSLAAEELNGFHFIRTAVNQKGGSTNMQMTAVENGKPVSNGSQFNWYDGIIYSLMIDRFFDGDKSNDKPIRNDSLFRKANYNGGDLAGIIKKIDEEYFDSLGINVLWISPVYDNPNRAYREYPVPHRWFSGYHGYWPISSTRIDEHFGSIELLRQLVAKAHKHKIKVLLDFVSNHVHKEHPFFNEHRDWFGKLEMPDGRLNLRLWDEMRLTTWFEPYLPSFDYMNSKEALDTMTGNALWWLRTTGADGFRHDAVKHVPYVFWRELTRKLKKEFPNKEIYQIGETFGGYDLVSSYVNNGQLSSQFNFNLYNTALAAFIDSNASFINLINELKKTNSIYGPLHLMGNIMDSHDKNRYMAYADGDLDLAQWSDVEEGWNNPPVVDHPSSYKKAELYYAYMFSIPGLPVIYYGSEFGMTGASDPDNRRPMRFGSQLSKNEKQMLKKVSGLVNLRRNHTSLRYGDFLPLYADKDLLSYIRSDLNERILVVINKSRIDKRLDVNLPSIYMVDKLIDLISGDKIYPERDLTTIVVGGYSYRFLKLLNHN